MDSLPTADDVHAHIARLFVYPIKSCGGIELDATTIASTGFAHDRQWMLVDTDRIFVTQRELARMVLVRVALSDGGLRLSAPGMPALDIDDAVTGKPLPAQVWNDTVACVDAGDDAAEWFSTFLGERLRLVRIAPDARRIANRAWTGIYTAPVSLSDGYPILVLSEATLEGLNARLAARGHGPVGIERFRPNLVLGGLDMHDEDHLKTLTIPSDGAGGAQVRLELVKPCPRCPIPDIDPATAASDPSVSDTLLAYRRNPIVDGAPTFGMNAIAIDAEGASLRVGMRVAGRYDFA